jgi:hypothetical protein
MIINIMRLSIISKSRMTLQNDSMHNVLFCNTQKDIFYDHIEYDHAEYDHAVILLNVVMPSAVAPKKMHTSASFNSLYDFIFTEKPIFMILV